MTPEPATAPATEAISARELSTLRVLLGMDAPPADFAGIGVARPPSAAQFALLEQTMNEWALRIPPAEMASMHTATLGWLYIQSHSAAEIGRLCYTAAGFDRAKFETAVLEWSDRTDPKTGEAVFSIAMLNAATAYIADVMTMKAGLAYDIEEKKPKPGEPPPPPPETPPPN